MKNNTLISLRSNCTFSLDYKTGKIEPQTEVILITSAPKYVHDKKKNQLIKESDISEYRFISDLNGINQLIGEMQLLVKNVTNFEQTAAAFNMILASQQEQTT